MQIFTSICSPSVDANLIRDEKLFALHDVLKGLDL